MRLSVLRRPVWPVRGTGLTGGVGWQCRPVRPVGRTGLTGLDKSELMTASVVVGSVLFKLQSSIVKEVCKLFVYI